jgi:hypothetical protein
MSGTDLLRHSPPASDALAGWLLALPDEVFADKQTGAMQSDSYGSRTKACDFRDLVVRQALHVAKDEHDSI